MNRGCGVLMPIFSLPSRHGIGDMGQVSYRFAEMLIESGVKFWQILPLNAGNPENGESPYFSSSAVAINPLLISLDLLVRDGLLKGQDLDKTCLEMMSDQINYNLVRTYKYSLFCEAIANFNDDQNLESFCDHEKQWLSDYALFIVLQRHLGNRWASWPSTLRNRDQAELSKIREKYAGEIRAEKILQFLAFSQWQELHSYCNKNGLEIIGDMPIYVGLESSDVWSNPGLFKLDNNMNPTEVSGVPPDFFSATGQLWNNPVYRWEAHLAENFTWWKTRMQILLSLYDIVRIDHFRGLVQYWAIPAGEKNAIKGMWCKAPYTQFFDMLTKTIPSSSLIAEDLGIITDEVRQVMKHYSFPGMRVLQFAFGETNPAHPYLPHNYPKNTIVYTGTHDNTTTLDWLKNEATPIERQRIKQYTGVRGNGPGQLWALIRIAMMSVAGLVVIPFQDILGLEAEARINCPSETFGNWQWRWNPVQNKPARGMKALAKMALLYNRSGKYPNLKLLKRWNRLDNR